MFTLLSFFATKCFYDFEISVIFQICDHSYTAAEEIVELQEVHNSSVVPDTYSAVGHVQESTSMEVAGTYSSVTQDTPSNGVPTTYSSVVHVQVRQGSLHNMSYFCLSCILTLSSGKQWYNSSYSKS